MRLSVGAFLHGLYQQGAFAGNAADQAYFVRCDATTCVGSGTDAGRCGLVIGFAPLKPSEFLVLQVALATASPADAGD